MTAEQKTRLSLGYSGTDELLAEADLVVVKFPYLQVTHHIIGKRESPQPDSLYLKTSNT